MANSRKFMSNKKREHELSRIYHELSLIIYMLITQKKEFNS